MVLCPPLSCPRRRGSSIPEAVVLESISRGVLDRPPARTMTAEKEARLVSYVLLDVFGEISTPSLRAQRSNPESRQDGRPDCFAALATTVDIAHTFSSSRRIQRPSDAHLLSLQLTEGAGKTEPRPGPMVRVQQKARGRTTGSAGKTRP